MNKLATGAIVLVLGATGVVTDVVINPYQDIGTSYKLEIKSEIPQQERVEISKDKAQMDLVGWYGEYRVSIKPQIPTNVLGAVDKDFIIPAKRPLFSNKVEYKSGDVTAFIEPK